ncbi:MAG: acyl-CoA thioesterase [Pseudomonadota bacterium]
MNGHEKTISAATAGARAFVYHHVVTFEETNLVGNVYYAKHISWQGRCREMFLRAHAPGVLKALASDLRLVTLRVACDYFDELFAFDEVDLHMRLTHQEQHRIGLDFEYWVHRQGKPRLAARGFQETGCLRESPTGVSPTMPPAELMHALHPYRIAATQPAAVAAGAPRAAAVHTA